jgi:hypothetical protein
VGLLEQIETLRSNCNLNDHFWFPGEVRSQRIFRAKDAFMNPIAGVMATRVAVGTQECMHCPDTRKMFRTSGAEMEKWSKWNPLTPEVKTAVRELFKPLGNV